MEKPLQKNMGVGVGLRDPHFSQFVLRPPIPASWVEVNAENYFPWQGTKCAKRHQVLLFVRQHMPVVLHGTSMSLGSVNHDNTAYLKELAKLANIIEPAHISDHLCWSADGGVYLHDLLPLPFNEE